jgi:hypothetical protein
VFSQGKPSPKPSALRLPPNKINKECVAASIAGLQQSKVQTWGWPFKPNPAKHVPIKGGFNQSGWWPGFYMEIKVQATSPSKGGLIDAAVGRLEAYRVILLLPIAGVVDGFGLNVKLFAQSFRQYL